MAYSCFLIGKDTLLIECASILKQRGFQINGVISSDLQVKQFCSEKGLTCFERITSLSVLEENPFDYLFSIVNDYIIPESMLRLPQQQTINYHDSLLPAYAGVHATFWALLNGEKTHGITWHVVDAGIDTGPILKQRQVTIAADETSISLNIKCYSAAITAFQELVDELSVGPVLGHAQAIVGRSYSARNKRPNTFIDWHQSAIETERLFRALEFGFYPSPYGKLKLKIGTDFLLVRQVNLSEDTDEGLFDPPGTILALVSNALRVKTNAGVLIIRALTTLRGEPISIASLRTQWGLSEGHVLTQPLPDFVQKNTQVDRQCVNHQDYWRSKLRRIPTSASSISDLIAADHDDHHQGTTAIPLRLSTRIEAALAAVLSTDDRIDQLIIALLLAVTRLSGQSSINVGYSSPESRQVASETGGLFASCLPFLPSFDWESGFNEALQTIHQEREAVEAHRSFAYDWLVNQPVIQSPGQPEQILDFPIVLYRSADNADVPTVTDKTIILVINEKGYCRVVYDSASWATNQVTELLMRWLLVWENLLNYPTQSLKSISLLTPEEQQRLLVEWNDTATDYPRHQPVHQLVEAQAEQQPLAEAVRCETTVLTYDQLNQQANQFARHLCNIGVKPDTLVGLCVERSSAMIVSLLAILKAGGAYVPLDPTYPPERLATLQKQTGVQFIITQEKWLNRFSAESTTSILLDQTRPPWATESTQNLAIPIHADQLAYVLFTSGSTGQPKNVAIPHQGIVRLVRDTNYMRLDNTVRMLGLAPLAFDASTLEIWGCLTNGGQLVLLDDARPSLNAIKQTIRSHQVNTAFFTAALFNVLVDSGIDELTTLTQLATGGEAASPEHVRRAQRQLPACTLINCYGPTESTTIASYFIMSATDWTTRSVPIGKPISNTRLYIVDAFDNPVPVGVAGELLIGGDGLARGYLFQPELTDQKFIADPFTTPDQRLYRTGDQARFLRDGTIEFMGRFDDQLKIRGFRIEPGEIEYSLCQYPTVGEAVVLAVEPTPGHKVLVAYLVAKPNTTVMPEEIRLFLKTKLPDYLIPTAFVVLEAMPLMDNGKLNKSQLPPPFFRDQIDIEEPFTATESALMPLWTATLTNRNCRLDDNFFELGGSSLLAMQLLGRIHQQVGRQLSIKAVFEHPTLRQLAAYIDQHGQTDVLPISAPMPQSEPDAESPLPLSFAQNRLWIIHQFHALGGTYNVPIVLKISGPFNPAIFQACLTEIIRRHQLLRTRFGHINGSPFQSVIPLEAIRIPISETSFESLYPPDSLNEWLIREAYQPFNLAEAPLVRASLASLQADSWVVLLVFHHIIYDGWSIRVLAKELSNLYTARVRQQSVRLPELAMQYAVYAQWQLDYFTFERLQRERTYWIDRLTGSPFLINLPLDKPRPTVQSFKGADYLFSLPDDLWQSIRYGLQEPGTTLFLRLLTVTAIWLGRITQSTDFIIGIPVAGRNRPELAPMIGFFVNTIALRIQLTATHSFRQLLRQVRQWALEAYEHQELPFEQVVEALKLPRTLAHTPLVQVLFDVIEDTSKDWQLDGLITEVLPFEQHRAKFDLHLSFRERIGGLDGIINYQTDLFNPPTIVRMADDFITLLRALVTDPNKPIDQLFGQVVPQLPPQPELIPTLIPANDLSDSLIQYKPSDQALASLLRTIWYWLLGETTVTLDDDFFDVGGHSLLALQMTLELKKQSGHTISVGDVFANPTIRQLVTYLRSTHTNHVWPSLVAVKPNGSQKPLFLVHPISGDIGYVFQLAFYMPENQPIYGLRAVGLDGIAQPLSSIEAMATYYLQLLLALQPDGPYTIGGYSLGGIIAFEIAHQLRQLGKDVKPVILIDSYPINPNAENPDQIPLKQLIGYYYDVWRTLPKRPGSLWAMFRKKVPVAGSSLVNQVRRSLQRYLIKQQPNRTTSQISESENSLVIMNQRAYSNYVFRPYDGKVVLLRAAGEDGFVEGNHTIRFGWDRYAKGGVDVHLIPGNHYSLFKNDATIQKMAMLIQSYLTSE